MIFTEGLFQHALINPAIERGATKLYIVSGYATPAMAFHHLTKLNEQGVDISVELIVGMCPQDGLRQSYHRGFKQLVENDFVEKFKCSYMTVKPPVHSKMYAWFDEESPVIAFAGSANYTQAAFRGAMRELLVECNPSDCMGYFESLIASTIYCDHQDAERSIMIYDDKTFEKLTWNIISFHPEFYIHL
jgi:phosphatidylserine/phosphatidylglycerophosphate/cardiolipin synthase-like enzyme